MIAAMMVESNIQLEIWEIQAHLWAHICVICVICVTFPSFFRSWERTKQESTPAEAKMAKISVLGAKTPKLPDDLLFGYEISPELFP